MTTPTQITTHVTDALDRFIEQFRGQPLLEGLATAFINQTQDVEDATFDMILSRALDNATGQQLDNWGSLLGEIRDGRFDNDYRASLQIRILRNAGEGDPESIIQAALSLSGASSIALIEQGNGWIRLELLGVNLSDPSRFIRDVSVSVLGGVGMYVIEASITLPSFSYTSVNQTLSVIPQPTRGGYGSVNFPGVGGRYNRTVGSSV